MAIKVYLLMGHSLTVTMLLSACAIMHWTKWVGELEWFCQYSGLKKKK